jgi:hypothetical protein
MEPVAHSQTFCGKIIPHMSSFSVVDSPTPVSVMLCSEAMRDSVNKITNRNFTMCAVELLVPGDYNIEATLNLADGSEMFCLDIFTELV